MRDDQIIDQQDYEGDFWPGFVDILSGLILVFSFLVLVAGIIIAVIIEIDSTVEVPPEPFENILNIVKESPITIPSRFDVIENTVPGDEPQVLVAETVRQLEIIGERSNTILKDFPVLERKLTQEIRFLQEELRIVQSSPPPEGETQKAADFRGGLDDGQNADNFISESINWRARVDGQDIFITFSDPSSNLPDEEIAGELRNSIRNWVNAQSTLGTVSIIVASAITPFETIAQRDSLKRVLYVRSILRKVNPGIKVSIQSFANTLAQEGNGWIRLKNNP